MGKAIRDPELEALCSLSLFPSRLSGGSLLESIEVYHLHDNPEVCREVLT